MKLIFPKEKSDKNERDVEEIDFLLTKSSESLEEAFWVSVIFGQMQIDFDNYVKAIYDFYSNISFNDTLEFYESGHGLKFTDEKILYFNPLPDNLLIEIDKGDFFTMIKEIIQRKGERSAFVFGFYSWGKKNYPQ